MVYGSYNRDTLDRSIFRTLSGHGTSSAVEYLDEKGKTQFYHIPDAACWGHMRSSMAQFAKPGITPINFYSCLHGATSKDYADVTRPYWNFVFDKDKSPWRSLLKEGQGFDWESPIGLSAAAAAKSPYSFARIPISKETNMQTLVSLLIAARVGSDVPAVLNMFTSLTEDGWPEVDALYATTYVGRQQDGVVIDMRNRDYYAFTARYDNVYARFVKAEPAANPSAVFGKDYGFLQGMWTEAKISQTEMVDRLPPTKFMKVMSPENRKYDGMFPKRFKSYYPNTDLMPNKRMRPYKDIVKMREEIINAVSK